MSEELKQAFDVLDVNTKRNQISNELIVIYELIRNNSDPEKEQNDSVIRPLPF